MIAEVKRVLEEESDASPNQFVNRARNNQWGVGDQQGDFPEHHERHQVSSICSVSSSDIEHRQQQLTYLVNVSRFYEFCDLRFL